MSSVGEKLQSASASLFKAAKGGDEAAARAALDAATAAGVDPDQSWTATSITHWKDGPVRAWPLTFTRGGAGGPAATQRAHARDRAACSACVQNQSTPLHYAAANGHASVVKLLVERGADLNATNMVRATLAAHSPGVALQLAANSNRRRYASPHALLSACTGPWARVWAAAAR